MEYTERIKTYEFQRMVENSQYKDAISVIIDEVKFNYSFIQDKARDEVNEVYESILIYGEELEFNSAVDDKLFAFIKFRREVFMDLFIKTVRGLK